MRALAVYKVDPAKRATMESDAASIVDWASALFYAPPTFTATDKTIRFEIDPRDGFQLKMKVPPGWKRV